MAGIGPLVGPSFIWCALQVSFVAATGIISSRLVSKRNPFAACSIVCTSVAVSLILTLLAPLPVHRCLVARFQQSQISNDHIDVVDSEGTVPENPASDDPARAQVHLGWSDLRRAAWAMGSMVKDLEEFETEPRSGFRWIGSLLMMIVSAGLLRFVAGVVLVFRIRRGSHQLSDERLTSILHPLMSRLASRKRIETREHAELKDAAVAGWFYPVVILPCDWRQWSDQDLRSVVAHELAHIVRNDTIWRFITSILSAIHCYNPFMYGLLRRVTIHQELAADALAASLVGQKAYLHSLSRLAIRHDDLSRGIVPPDIMPVFSGHLIRRIKMLNSTDGLSSLAMRRKNAGRSFAISAAFCLIGFAALATRGIAEPADDDKPVPGKPATDDSVVAADTASPAKPTTDPTQGMFQHAPLNPSLGIKHPDGMMVVRMRELLQHRSLQPYAPALNALIATSLSKALKSDAIPDVNFESIEWVAATPSFSFFEQKDDPSEKNHRLMMGLGGAVIRFHRPIDLKGWLKRFAPAASEQEIEGRIVYELKLPYLGPQPCYIWQSDETTLQSCVYTREFSNARSVTPKEISESIKSGNSEADPARLPWIATWNRTDAGLVSIVLSSADLSGVNDRFYEKCKKEGPLAIAAGNFIRELRSRCKTTAILLDLANGDDLGIRLSLVHESRDSAKRSAKQLEELVALVTSEIDSQIKQLDSNDPKTAGELASYRLFSHLLRTGHDSIQDYADGTASLNVSTVIPIQRMIEVLGQVD